MTTPINGSKEFSWTYEALEKYEDAAFFAEELKTNGHELHMRMAELFEVLASKERTITCFPSGVSQEKLGRIWAVAMDTGLFSYQNLKIAGHRYFASLLEACKRNDSTLALSLIKIGLPVSGLVIDYVRKNTMTDVLRAILERPLPLPPDHIVKIIHYSNSKLNRAFIHMLSARTDVTAAHWQQALQQICLRGHRRAAHFLLTELDTTKLGDMYPPAIHRAVIAQDVPQLKQLIEAVPKEERRKIWPLTGQTALQLALSWQGRPTRNSHWIAYLKNQHIAQLLAHADTDLSIKVISEHATIDYPVHSMLLSSYTAVLSPEFGLTCRSIEVWENDTYEFIQLLNYCVSGRLTINPYSFGPLVRLADKYGFKGLQKQFQEWLAQNPEHVVTDEERSHIQTLPETSASPVAPAAISFPRKKIDNFESVEALFHALFAHEEVPILSVFCWMCEQGWASGVSFVLQNFLPSPAFLNQELIGSIRRGYLPIARLLVERGANREAVSPQQGWTALHLAVDAPHNRFELVTLLIPDPRRVSLEYINARNRNSLTAFSLSLANRDVETCTYLLLAGADPMIDDNPEDEITALIAAARDKLWPLLPVIIRNIPADKKSGYINTMSDEGETALGYAFLGDHEESVRTLLAEGAEITADVFTQVVDKKAVAPASKVLKEVPPEKRRELVNSPDSGEDTALHYACYNDDQPMIQFLLEAGADVWRTDHTKERSALHAFMYGSSFKSLDFLLDHIPQERMREFLNLPDHKGKTALHLLCKKAKNEKDALAVIDTLIKRGAGVLFEDGQEKTAAQVARNHLNTLLAIRLELTELSPEQKDLLAPYLT